jgi:hypothetical protein
VRNSIASEPAFDDHSQHELNNEHRSDENLEDNEPAEVRGHNGLLYCEDKRKQVYADHYDIIKAEPRRIQYSSCMPLRRSPRSHHSECSISANIRKISGPSTPQPWSSYALMTNLAYCHLVRLVVGEMRLPQCPHHQSVRSSQVGRLHHQNTFPSFFDFPTLLRFRI